MRACPGLAGGEVDRDVDVVVVCPRSKGGGGGEGGSEFENSRRESSLLNRAWWKQPSTGRPSTNLCPLSRGIDGDAHEHASPYHLV